MANKKKTVILLVNPANTTKGALMDYETSIYPNLGLLTLGSALENNLNREGLDAEVFYLDGALYGNDKIYEQITQLYHNIVILGLSCYTYNYASCLEIAKYAKQLNPNTIIVIGNDHFSAISSLIMSKRSDIINYGFYGNDIVNGFTNFVTDTLLGKVNLSTYAGLVYREHSGTIKFNPEDPTEFEHIPLVNYGLQDSLLPHDELYHRAQKSFYSYIQNDSFKVTVVDIARGCLKFGGKRNDANIPLNACDFCGIIPGSRAIAFQSTQRAWEIIKNAYEQGYNYLFLTADEFPSTFWSLAKDMVQMMPEWYIKTPVRLRPKIMCYARADSFRDNLIPRIDLLMGQLGFDHFFVGLDGFTTHSLKAMRKGLNSINNDSAELIDYNFKAIHEIAQRKGKITAGAVITHIGITRELLEQNFTVLKEFIEKYSLYFIELDFELLCPIPGSHAFSYLTVPGVAQKRAQELSIEVNNQYLMKMYDKYKEEDLFDPEELVNDFILSCCPDITIELAREYLNRIRDLVDKYHIPYECSSL